MLRRNTSRRWSRPGGLDYLPETLERAAAGAAGGGRALVLVAEDHAALVEVVGRHLDRDLVAGQHADAVLAHLAAGVGDDVVAVLELDAEAAVGIDVDDDALGFEQSFFRHAVTLGVAPMRASNGAGNEALR